MRKKTLFTDQEIETFNKNNGIFTPEQLKIISRKTPKSEIEIKKDETGFEYKSVKSSYVKALVTLVTGGNYNFEIKDQFFVAGAKQVRTLARLTIFSNNDRAIFRDQVGKAEASTPDSNSYKASASDAFKKCASEYGFCWDIYNQERPIPDTNKETELSNEGKLKLTRLDHFLSECQDYKSIEHNYNIFLKSSKESEQSKALLSKHMKRLGFFETDLKH